LVEFFSNSIFFCIFIQEAAQSSSMQNYSSNFAQNYGNSYIHRPLPKKPNQVPVSSAQRECLNGRYQSQYFNPPMYAQKGKAKLPIQKNMNRMKPKSPIEPNFDEPDDLRRLVTRERNQKYREKKIMEDPDDYRRRKAESQKRYLMKLKIQDPEGFRRKKSEQQKRYMEKKSMNNYLLLN